MTKATVKEILEAQGHLIERSIKEVRGSIRNLDYQFRLAVKNENYKKAKKIRDLINEAKAELAAIK